MDELDRINLVNDIARLARSNINILSIEAVNEQDLFVVFEFQWRDSRNHSARWCKTCIEIDKGQNLADYAVLEIILDIVSDARKVLEGGNYGL